MIASTTNTLAATTPTAGSGDVASLRRERSKRGVDATGGSAAELVFAALLSKTNALAGTTARGEPKASSFQMFEPNTGDARGRRQASLEADSRAGGPLRMAGETANLRSVAARRAAKDAGTAAGQGGADPQKSSARPASLVEPEIPRDTATSNRHRGVAGIQRPNVIQKEQAMGRRAGSRLVSHAELVSQSAQEAGAVSSTLTTSHVNGASDGLAHDVARALRVGLSADVESARAPTPPAGPARSAQHDQDRSAKATRNAQRGHTREARSSGEASKTARSAFERLVRSIRLQTGTHRSFARLHLEPPELGRVSVDLQLVGNELRIEVRAERAEARKLLYERVTRLRAALEQHGIRIERFEVVGDLGTNRPDASTTQQESVSGDGQGGDEVGDEGSGRRASSDRSGKPIADPLAPVGDGRPVETEIGKELTTVGERRLDVRV